MWYKPVGLNSAMRAYRGDVIACPSKAPSSFAGYDQSSAYCTPDVGRTWQGCLQKLRTKAPVRERRRDPPNLARALPLTRPTTVLLLQLAGGFKNVSQHNWRLRHPGTTVLMNERMDGVHMTKLSAERAGHTRRRAHRARRQWRRSGQTHN